MLIELNVTNFAIIENLHINFKTGLNILSGETGAGKSVLFKSLAMLMGEKASNDEVRSGCTSASIEGVFDLEHRPDIVKILNEHDIVCEDQTLVVRRTVSKNEKSRVYLNGMISNLSKLKDLVAPLIEVAGQGAPLIEMTGQHDSKHLLSKSYHIDLLDQFASTWDLRNQVQVIFNEIQITNEQITRLKDNEKFKNQRIDYLNFQKNELSELDIKPGEETEIEMSIRKLKGAHRLSGFLDMAENLLYDDEGSVDSRLKSLLKQSLELKGIDPEISDRSCGFEQALQVIESTFFDLRNHIKKIEFDPEQLEGLEKKLSALRKIQKKYGTSIEDILESKAKIEVELNNLLESEKVLKTLALRVLELTTEYNKIAEKLHDKRIASAKLLAKKVNEELLDLNMKGVTFHVQVDKFSHSTSTGISDVEFQSQTSSKDQKRSLSKFASGGELSRILLSIKRVVGSGKYPRTYLFDEVDAGVSGVTAEKVGKKLSEISSDQQVICVTHLPQVAAYGHHHFYIEKSPQKGLAVMMVTELNGEKRIEEIARLISGEKITKTSIAHAKELLLH